MIDERLIIKVKDYMLPRPKHRSKFIITPTEILPIIVVSTDE